MREQASLLDLTHDTIFVRNHDDVITYWNRAATELYGWRPEQAIGRKAAELLQTEFPAPFDDDHVGAHAHRTLGRRIGAYRPRRPAARRGQPLGAAARRAAAVRSRSSRPTTTSPSAARSRTACTAPRRELAHVARVATLGELTASIAHEVNQPLAAVVTNGEACLRWLGRAVPDIGQARSSVEHMISNGQRASEVVRRLRALSRKSDPS